MTLQVLWANNALATLASGITSAATTLTVTSGTGALFPNPASGTQFFPLTLISAGNSATQEIVYCTARSGDALTITRAQEGTTALAWGAGDLAQNLLTASTVALFVQPPETITWTGAHTFDSTVAVVGNATLDANLTVNGQFYLGGEAYFGGIGTSFIANYYEGQPILTFVPYNEIKYSTGVGMIIVSDQQIELNPGNGSGRNAVVNGNQIATLDQFVNPISAAAQANSGGPASGTTCTVSFYAPSGGILVASGARNNSTEFTSAYAGSLYINGTQVQTDTTKDSMTHFGTTVISAAQTVTAQYVSSGNYQFSVQVLLTFIPNPP